MSAEWIGVNERVSALGELEGFPPCGESHMLAFVSGLGVGTHSETIGRKGEIAVANGNKPPAKFANPAHRVALGTPDPWQDLVTGPAAGPYPSEDMGYLLKLAPY